MNSTIENYTALSGDIDDPRTDIKCFSVNEYTDNRMNAKAPKILSHKFIHSDISIWTDANIWLQIPVEKLVEEWLDGYDMAVFKHPARNNAYEEAKKCIKKFPHWEEIINKQVKLYRDSGFDGNLAECGVIIRRNNDLVNEFNEAWWEEIIKYSPRDQISFPYVLSRFPSLKVNYINGDVRKHKYFKHRQHKKFPTYKPDQL